MKRLTFIVGLPGSGKTHLANTLLGDDGVLIDDISVMTNSNIGVDGDHLIVTDPNACYHDPERVMAKLRVWFGERQITVLAFENDPDQCWANIALRNDDRRISRAGINAMAARYSPSQWGEVVPVWRD